MHSLGNLDTVGRRTDNVMTNAYRSPDEVFLCIYNVSCVLKAKHSLGNLNNVSQRTDNAMTNACHTILSLYIYGSTTLVLYDDYRNTYYCTPNIK